MNDVVEELLALGIPLCLRRVESGEFAKGNMAMQNGEVMEIQRIPGQQYQVDEKQVKNSAQGFVFQANAINRLKRYLVLGSESGTYYADGRELGKQNVSSLLALLKEGRGKEAVEVIREYSVEGRCAKQNTIVYCLALCARYHDGNHSANYVATRKEAYKILPDVCRIPTDLFHFVQYCEDISKGIDDKTGWGRAHRKAIRKWYLEKSGRRLAFLVTKYKQRDGWSHKDLIKLCHPRVGTEYPSQGIVFKHIIKGFDVANSYVNNRENSHPVDEETSKTIGLLDAVNKATSIGNATDVPFAEREAQILYLIRTHDLVREHLPTEFLTSLKVSIIMVCMYG